MAKKKPAKCCGNCKWSHFNRTASGRIRRIRPHQYGDCNFPVDREAVVTYLFKHLPESIAATKAEGSFWVGGVWSTDGTHCGVWAKREV